MPEPDLIQQQCEILRVFRQATGQRAKAEGDAEARRKADRAAADAALNKIQQDTEAQQAKVGAEAEARRKAERTAADAALNQARQTAAIQLAQTRKVLEEVQAVLAQANLQRLLEQTRPSPTPRRSGADPAQKLARCVSIATEAPTSIQAGIEELQRWREAAASRRLLAVFAIFAIIALLILAAVVLLQYRARQMNLNQLYWSAVAALDGGQWDTAQAEFQQLISMDSNYKDAQTLLCESYYRPALAYLKVKEWGKARGELQVLVKLDANYRDVQALLKETYYGAGVDYLNAGDMVKAKIELLELLREYGNYRNVIELLVEYFPATKLSIASLTTSGWHHSDPLENTIDGNVETLAQLQAVREEGHGAINAWLEMTLDRPALVTKIRYYCRESEDDRASPGHPNPWAQLKIATIPFSDGSTQSIRLNETPGWYEMDLEPVFASSVHIRATEIYHGWWSDNWLEVVDVALYGY
jgi:tetratricopeptide (TPR) repeat protein